jgi:hypothetical protein
VSIEALAQLPEWLVAPGLTRRVSPEWASRRRCGCTWDDGPSGLISGKRIEVGNFEPAGVVTDKVQTSLNFLK